MINADAFFNSRSKHLAELARRHAVPTVYQYREFAAAGGLASYGSRLDDAIVRLAPIPVGFSRVINRLIYRSSGGNLTGFTSFEFSIGTKWLEMLKVVAPHITRVALVFNPKTAPFADLFWRPVEAAASSFDVTAVSAPAHDAAEIENVLDLFAREPNGGLMVLPEVSTVNQRDLIITIAARHRLPAIYPFRSFAASGGLLSYGIDVSDIFQRAASYVDRILKGARPGELPVQGQTKFELVMNLRAAKMLGIAMPPLLLARADEVIE